MEAGAAVAREDQARDTRDRLLAAARQLLGYLTYEEIRVDEIARRGEVGRTTFYLHFESKAEIYREIAAEETGSLIQLAGDLGSIDPESETALGDYIDECERRFGECRRYLEIAALSVDPSESSDWVAGSNRVIVARSVEAIERSGAVPSPTAAADLALAGTLLLNFMLVYPALGNDAPEGWKAGLASHLRLALERARDST